MQNNSIEDILNRPFEKFQIKKRTGMHGKILDYVEGANVVRRMNEAFGPTKWSVEFEVIDIRQINENLFDIIAKALLTAEHGGFISRKNAYGGARGSGECRGDVVKSACTDAFKKAASYYGIALDLWLDEADRNEHNEHEETNTSTDAFGWVSASTIKEDPATEPQLDLIRDLAKSIYETGIDELEKIIDKPLRLLTKNEASELIKRLKADPSAPVEYASKKQQDLIFYRAKQKGLTKENLLLLTGGKHANEIPKIDVDSILKHIDEIQQEEGFEYEIEYR